MKIKQLSKNSFVGPKICLGLLGVCALAMLFPISSSPEADATGGYDVMPLAVDPEGHIALTLKGAAEQVTTATADQVSYRTNQFDVTYSQTSKYVIQVNSMNGYGSNLYGKANPGATIKGVGENKTPAQFGNNTWGYAIGNGTSDGSNLTYNTVPEYNTQTTPKEVTVSNIQDADQTDSYTLAFAAKIGSDSPADHYISKVYLSVVRTPGRTYTVTYNANKPAAATGTVANVPTAGKFIDTGNASEVFKLSSTSPTLNKYKFMGWSTTQQGAFTDKTQAAAAVQYAPGATYDVSDASTPTSLALYAVWLLSPGITGIDTMQEMSVAVCNESEVNDTKQLKDTRDNKTYWVAKLKDERCWMTQNLDFDVPATLSNTTSNVSSASKNTGANKITSISSWPSSGDNSKNYYDMGEWYYNGPSGNHSQDTNNSCSGVTSTSGCSLFSTSGSDKHYHVGNYYSYSLATLGTRDGQTSGNATESICPKGWKLPTSNSNTEVGSFGYLLTKYGLQSSLTSGSYAIYNNPLYFVYGGYLQDGNLNNAGTQGRYWSSTPYDASRAYNLIFDNGVNPSDNTARYIGQSVRCVNDTAIVE